MTFQKKESVQPEQPQEITAMFGSDTKDKDPGSTPPVAAAQFEILPRFKQDKAEINDDLCIVLYGYGVDAPGFVKYVDDYKFVGGVGRNIPRIVANAWKKGIRWQDGKPAISRIYPQAILSAHASEVDFAKATGVQPMPAAQLAAMIGATDAEALVAAMGRQQAVALAEQLLARSGRSNK